MIGAHFFSTLAGTVDGCIVLRNKQGELSQQGKMKMTLPNSPYFQPLGVGKKQNKLKIILIWIILNKAEVSRAVRLIKGKSIYN